MWWTKDIGISDLMWCDVSKAALGIVLITTGVLLPPLSLILVPIGGLVMIVWQPGRL